MEKNSASQEVLEGYLEDDENWESANLLFCLLAESAFRDVLAGA